MYESHLHILASESQEVEQRLARIEEAQEQELEQIGAQLRELSLVSFWSVM